MNNQKIYSNLIQKAHSENRKKRSGIYYEEHHIIPLCLGGNDTPSNKVLLTAREHFLAHWLLVKIHKNNVKLKFAFNRMCNFNHDKNNIKNSYLYKYAREHYVKMLVDNEDWKNKLSKTFSKRIWIKKDNESLRISENEFDDYIKRGYSLGRIIKNRKPHSDETKKKISKKHKGRICPNKGRTLKTKGLTYEQIYGTDVANQLKEKRRVKMIETNNKQKT